jgi:hypothetical protein
MKEPKRLFESGSSLERSILGFGRDEAPSDDLSRKTLAAMAAASTASVAPVASRWPRPRVIYASAAAIGLGALLVVTGVVLHSSEPVSQERSAPVPMLEQAPPAPAPLSEAPKKEVAVTPDSLPSAPDSLPRVPTPSTASVPSGSTLVEPPRSAAVKAPPARHAAPAAGDVGSASIAREVELLDSVKAKLGGGDVAEASRVLDTYDSEFPSGTLRPEATVLRVRMLLARGDRAGADKVGNAFLAKHPSGVHAKRVRSLLGLTEN